MPRDLNLNLAVDAIGFAANFRDALALLGNEPALPRSRRPMRGEPMVIEHDADQS